MDKKELKRLLKLDLYNFNSIAMERNIARTRAENAEAFIERLVKACYPDKFLHLSRPEDQSEIFDWYVKLKSIAGEWKNREASNG